MTIDWSKPVQTRDGRPVEIITAKARGQYSMLGYIGDRPALWAWDRDGRWSAHSSPDVNDLINVPEERELWLNVYEDGEGYAHVTRTLAENGERIRVDKTIPRIACVHVKYRVGEGLTDDR